MTKPLSLLLALLAVPAVARANEPGVPPGIPAAIKDEVSRTYRVLLTGKRCFLGSTVGVVAADCSDPARLRYLGGLALSDSVSDIALVNGKLAVANGPKGIVLAENGDRPRRISGLVLSGAAMGLAASGNKLLVAAGTAGLHLLDVSDAAKPRALAHLDTPGYARGVSVSADLVALADGDYGVRLFRLQGNHLSEVSRLQPRDLKLHAFEVAFSGPLLLVAGGPAGLLVVDISQPKTPRMLGRLAVRDAARGISVQGQRAAVADGIDGVMLVDLSKPASPRETGRLKTKRMANRVLLNGELVYVANDYGGLLILQAPPSGNPVPLGSLPAKQKN